MDRPLFTNDRATARRRWLASGLILSVCALSTPMIWKFANQDKALKTLDKSGIELQHSSHNKQALIPIKINWDKPSNSESTAQLLAVNTASQDKNLNEAPLVVAANIPAVATPAKPPEKLSPQAAEVITNLIDLEAEIANAPAALDWHELVVKPGDTLSGLFERLEMGPSQWLPVTKLGKTTKPLTRMRVGDHLRLAKNATGQFARLEYPIDSTQTLTVWRDGDGLKSEWLEHKIEARTVATSGVIEHSLFGAGNKAGMSDKLIMELAEIFGSHIDFVLDIRGGDQFSLLYQDLYRDGEYLGNGKILAAEFVNKGKPVRAVRYTDTKGRSGYYDPEGRSMRQAFIRTPVDFARVSSGFNMRRRHPVLNTIRAHKGVDYAAPRGTRIKSAGDGRVVFAGVKGGYGKVVIIQHGPTYSTLYAHMKGYARGVRSGRRVSQGQTIGYVGSSGLATGPHLHYEFRVNGVHRNPLTVKLPVASPLAKEYLVDFQSQSEPLLAWLDGIANPGVASGSNADSIELTLEAAP